MSAAPLPGEDIAAWLRANDVTRVRLEATNHDGLQLGKYLSAPKFLSVLEKGAVFADTCFGVDLGGEVAVGWDWGPWRGEVSDIKVMPDPATLIADGGAPGWASALGDFSDLDGNPLPPCYRGLLKRMVARLGESGYEAVVAPELELMVFEEPLSEARAKAYAGLTPLGGGMRVTYLMSTSPDLARFMDATCRRIEELGVSWEYWSNETAPGQVEINLAPADPVTCADAVIRTKQAVREVAAEQGRSVTFMAYGIDEYLGGGMHINLSLLHDGANAFFDAGANANHSEVQLRCVAGLLATLPGAMSMLTPNPNSYRRLVDITGPPTSVTWAEDNKSVAVRTVTREPESSRVEHRVPSADCNIYLALAAILAGAIVGIERKLEPPSPFEGMAWALPPGTVPMLPATLREAAAALAADEKLGDVLGKDMVDYWLGSRRWEWIAFHRGGGDPDAVGEAELRRYFEQV